MKHSYKNKENKSIVLKLNKKTAIISVSVLVASIALYLVVKVYLTPINFVNYNGLPLEFSVNLREANNILVEPDENAVKNLINNRDVEKITFIIKNTPDSFLTKLEAVEITLKLSYALRIFDSSFFTNVIEVESFDNLNSTSETPYIILMPPSIADGTYVKVVDNSVFISGEDKNGFNLATAKFIISSLGINV